MKRSEGYARLSQSGTEDNIPTQGRLITEYCDDRDEMELQAIHNDGEQTSGYDVDRDAYQTLMDRIRTGIVDAVVVKSLSRLGRDFDERMDLMITMRRRGVELHSRQRGQIDISDPWSAAKEAMLAAADSEQKRMEIENAIEEIERRIDRGEYQGRPWKGTEFDDEGRYLVPAEDDDWDAVMEVVEEWDEDASKRGLARETGLPRSTVRRVIDRIDAYRALADGAGIGWEGRVVWPAGQPGQFADD
ncbi:recombinase family protein [Natrialbaceae archaeon A-chndr2]